MTSINITKQEVQFHEYKKKKDYLAINKSVPRDMPRGKKNKTTEATNISRGCALGLILRTHLQHKPCVVVELEEEGKKIKGKPKRERES